MTRPSITSDRHGLRTIFSVLRTEKSLHRYEISRTRHWATMTGKSSRHRRHTQRALATSGWARLRQRAASKSLAMQSIGKSRSCLGRTCPGGSLRSMACLSGISPPSCTACLFATIHTDAPPFSVLFSWTPLRSGRSLVQFSLRLIKNGQSIPIYSARILPALSTCMSAMSPLGTCRARVESSFDSSLDD